MNIQIKVKDKHQQNVQRASHKLYYLRWKVPLANECADNLTHYGIF